MTGIPSPGSPSHSKLKTRAAGLQHSREALGKVGEINHPKVKIAGQILVLGNRHDFKIVPAKNRHARMPLSLALPSRTH